MDALFQPVANLKGIGAKRAEALAKLGIQTPYDLLYHVPRSYLDYSHPVPVAAASLGETNVIRVQIVHKLVYPQGHDYLQGGGNRRRKRCDGRHVQQPVRFPGTASGELVPDVGKDTGESAAA